MATLNYCVRRGRSGQYVHRTILVLSGLFGLYVGSYLIVWRNAVPAANMAYFYYSNNERVDEIEHVAFYPIQRLHRRFGHGGWHQLDRVYPTAAEIEAAGP